MRTSPQDLVIQGLEYGKREAYRSSARAYQLWRTYGAQIERVHGGQPAGLGIGHILRVNPDGNTNPPVSKDGRKGFLKCSSTEANRAGVSWKNIEEPIANVYTWVYNINTDAETVDALIRGSGLEATDADFWETTYLYATLGHSTFRHYWDLRDRSASGIAVSLVGAVAAYPATLPGWPVTVLKKTILQQVPYVMAVATMIGSLSTKFRGRLPVLSSDDAKQVWKP